MVLGLFCLGFGRVKAEGWAHCYLLACVASVTFSRFLTYLLSLVCIQSNSCCYEKEERKHLSWDRLRDLVKIYRLWVV